jgi:UDP-N-acetylglucosamine:LPS N-acetylglucosamine transferase
MWASDLLVTKAGPNSIAEGMQCGLPLVLTGGIFGQETANMRFVEENRLGIVATTPDEVVKAVQRILEDPTTIAAIKAAIDRVHPPHAAHNIAQLILDTLPK